MVSNPKEFRSAAAHVHGLGAAKHGVTHWWMQRLSAVALIPLTIWFVVQLVLLAGSDYYQAHEQLELPINLGLMAMTLVAGIYHAQLGLQVIIEDYIHGAAKWVSLILVKLVAFSLIAASLAALIAIGFGK